MALITDSLSIWDISFRWADLDPDRFHVRFPLEVKDNFRLLMEAILSGEVLCETLTLAKRPSDSKADPNYYIRTYIDDVHSCVDGQKYNRKLLKWALIGRADFREWCDRRAIPYPEFWFPEGWRDSFDMPEEGTQALWACHVEPDGEGSVFSVRYDVPIMDDEVAATSEDIPSDADTKLGHNQVTKLLCQRIASEIWKDDISRTITSIVKDELIQKYADAGRYSEDTVRGWIKKIAPVEVSERRGRPRKNRDTEAS